VEPVLSSTFSTVKPAASRCATYSSGVSTNDERSSSRHRVGEVAVPDAHLLEHGEPGARDEHPVHLGEDDRLARDVHADVDHHRGVERRVVEGGRLPGRGHVADPVTQPHAVGQAGRSLDELRREVDAGDLGAGHRRHPGRAADAATDVQQPYAGPQVQLLEHVLGRRRTTGVQLVHGEEVGGPQAIRVRPCPGKRGDDRVAEVACSVVPPDEFADVHAPPPGRTVDHGGRRVTGQRREDPSQPVRGAAIPK
jgi:hypothetical protein